MTARKHFALNGHSEYFIGVDENLTKNLNDGNSIALMKAMNMMGSEYILYDQRFCSTHPENKEQLAAILYVSTNTPSLKINNNKIRMIILE